ncbi:IS5 family transposase [Hamadaea sp. NPDC050747]|uniref:IS5 family transposase n=1 Tax=Hamadaea sp. NPDC050747 TaxID=3155789 RepID=UPI0033DB249C
MATARPRRYPSDTSDIEWRLIAAYLPAGGTSDRGGRPVTYPRRDIVDAIRYLDHNGCVWRALPVDFPPWPTVYHYFRTWTRDGTLTRLHSGMREQVRLAEGRNAEPSAAIVDSQSVRAAEAVANTSRGYDAGKKVNGRKRHIVVDTTGLLLIILVTTAGVQDRDAARTLLWALRTCFNRVVRIWADGGYSGQLVDWAADVLGVAVEIVRKLADQVGFQVLHRRWVVERTLSWITRCRRTVRDYERHPEHHAAMAQWAMVIVMTRRLARYHRTGRLRPAAATTG